MLGAPRFEDKEMAMKKWFNAVFRPHYYAGAKAEDIFVKQAQAEKPPWPMERISQGKEEMRSYKHVAGGSVKRGDFICRRCNAEVEVKCKTKYEDPQGGYYLIDYSEIKRHRRMKDKVTKASVVFAFYERKGHSVLADTLRMVDLDFLLESSDYKKGKLYVKRNKCLKVPLRYTRKGFAVLDILLSKRTGDYQTRRA